MGLRNIIIPERVIPFGEGDITVRAISLTDIMILLDKHGPAMAAVWGKVQSDEQLTQKDIKVMIASTVGEFPDMAAALMATAADSYDEEAMATIKRLPIMTQVEVIEAIFVLTFPTQAEIKKLIDSLTRAITGVSGALTGMSSVSLTGIGESAAA